MRNRDILLAALALLILWEIIALILNRDILPAPTAVLADLVAVRIHLDDCGASSGPLRVVPGSHLYGRFAAKNARDRRQSNGEVTCTLRRGDALLMRPLLLHASSKAISDLPRRILHFLFGSPLLPLGLRWHHAV